MKQLSDLLQELKLQGVLDDPLVLEAISRIDHCDFVPESQLSIAYGNYSLAIGAGQTISQPYTVAFMLDLLGAEPGQRILDIGSGSGWTTALLGYIVGERGSVLGLERIRELVAYGKERLARYAMSQAEIRAAGPGLGTPGETYDRILVSAAADTLPEELVEQLLPGGRLVIPVGSSILRVCSPAAEDDTVSIESYYGFAFVPLIRA